MWSLWCLFKFNFTSAEENPAPVLQEYSEWKKEAPDISLPGVYIGLMDRLNSFSRVIVDSTQDLCAKIVSSYIEKVKETCNNGERGDSVQISEPGVFTPVENVQPVCHNKCEELQSGLFLSVSHTEAAKQPVLVCAHEWIRTVRHSDVFIFCFRPHGNKNHGSCDYLSEREQVDSRSEDTRRLPQV